jgi:hypothetical protein
MATDIHKLLPDLDGGVFEQKIASVLSDVALGVVTHGRQGKVTVEFDMKRIGETSQVSMKHTLKFDKPTKRGKAVEHDTTETPLHVANNGDMSLFHPNQMDFGFQHKKTMQES